MAEDLSKFIDETKSYFKKFHLQELRDILQKEEINGDDNLSRKTSTQIFDNKFNTDNIKDFLCQTLSQYVGQVNQSDENEESQAEDFSKNYSKNSLINTSTLKHYSIKFDFLTFTQHCPFVANILLSVDPIEAMKHIDFALTEVALLVNADLIEEDNEINNEINRTKITNLHARPFGLPPIKLIDKRNEFPTGQQCERRKLISIRGIVLKASSTSYIEYYRDYKCNVCNLNFKLEIDISDIDGNYFSNKWLTCKHCRSTKITAISGPGTKSGTDPRYLRQYQTIKLQEKVNKSRSTHLTQTINVVLLNELTDVLTIGDDVIVNAILLYRFPDRLFVNEEYTVQRYYYAFSIETKTKETSSIHSLDFHFELRVKEFWKRNLNDPIKARNQIIASICPHLHGLFVPKIAVTLLLAGGVEYFNESVDIKVRGDIHLLLIGDPGTGKSQLLNFASMLASRSVMTTASQQTAAGLTVSSKQGANKEWMIEAGVLVLANGGICCIDEFEAVSESDRLVLLEVMEQQTISVAKAGFIGKLNASCSILAASNPKGNQSDSKQSLRINSGLYGPLLSRFDLIIPLYDNSVIEENDRAKRDKKVSEVVFKRAMRSESEHKEFAKLNDDNEVWDTEMLKKYFRYIKNLKPVFRKKQVEEVLRVYYHKLRQAVVRDPNRTTVRLLESLIRISEAHARLMFREEILFMDVITAIALIEISMEKAALIIGSDALLPEFPKKPINFYHNQLSVILEHLDLTKHLDDALNELNNYQDLFNTTF